MDYEETMVDEMDTSVEADDTLQEDLVEETDESESIESVIEDEDTQPEEEPEEQGTSEPGWIKKRVAKEVEKAVARTRAEMQAMFDEQMAPIREQMIENQAKELVRNGTVKDLDTAKELVRYRQGQQPTVQQEQPRNDKGQFVSQEDAAQDASINTMINMLQRQVDYIKAQGGPDVVREYQNNPEIHEKVNSGEMDFYQVAEYMKSQKPKRKPPAPMRSPNGASGSEKSTIANMSDEQFDKFDKKVSGGARFAVN